MNETKPVQPSDEIDITQLFKWIGRGFRNLGMGFIAVLAALRNIFFTNKFFFLIVMIAGIVIGISYYQFLNKKFYKSSMIISCDYLNNRIMKNEIDKLNHLCFEKDREGLAEELKIDNSVAKNIRKFGFKAFIPEKDLIEMEVLKEQLISAVADRAEKKELLEKVFKKVDLEGMRSFEIEVLIYNPDIIKNLETAIISYFGDKEYIKKRVEINRQNLQTTKLKLIHDSNKLDSLKQIFYKNFESMATQNREGSNNVILSDKYLTNPVEIYTKDLTIHKDLMEVNEKLYIQTDFEVVDGFTTFKEPESASLLKILGVSLLFSWLTGYLIIGLLKFDRYLAGFSKEKINTT